MIWVAHAETSTGACQPMSELGAIARKHDALLMADTVTSIGGVPVQLDEWGVDAAYAGGQKALSCPPGIAPLTFGDRALRKMDLRAEARGGAGPRRAPGGGCCEPERPSATPGARRPASRPRTGTST